MDAQVIIVGAGPAGAWLAYHLARESISTIILERDRIPRYKSCGGALSGKASAVLSGEFSPDDIPSETIIDRLTFRCPDQPDVEHHSPGNGITLVMRDRFDEFLVDGARAAGATVIDGQVVREVQILPDGVTVRTREQQYRGDIIAGADGAGSAVARSLGIEPAQVGTALQGEVRGQFPEELTGRLTLDYGRIPSGYSWVFPKRDHLSIGTGSMSNPKLHLRRIFFTYLEELGIDAGSSEIFLRGHPIPSGTRTTLAGERFLLVGDAAHLADPLTGEGIHNALKSGQLAAEEITAAVRGGYSDLVRYSEAVRREMGPELRAAGLMARLIFRWPPAVHRMLRANSHLMETVMSVVQGGTSYGEAYVKMRGELLRGMWKGRR